MAEAIGQLPNGAPQYFPMPAPGVYDQTQKGPDGMTDSQRAIDPKSEDWAGDPDTDSAGLETDDRGESKA